MKLQNKVLMILAGVWVVVSLLMSVYANQTFLNEEKETIQYYLMVVIGMGFVVLLTVGYLLKWLVVDRVTSLSQQIVVINEKSTFDKRIHIKGNDEIKKLAASVNAMLEIIDLTQEQLKYRISQRTEELERLSELNKNLYAEVRYQKEIETHLREDKKILHQMAYYDSLTLLPNRVFFYELLQKAMDQSKETDSIAVMLMDSDKFKQVNDRHGHDTGDKYLQHCSNVIKNCLRNTDIIARLGGDEFILFITHFADKKAIDLIAEKILKALANPIKINDNEIQGTYSIGISFYPADGETIEMLEKCADLAMYYAKNKGGNNYCYYDTIVQHQPKLIIQPLP